METTMGVHVALALILSPVSIAIASEGPVTESEATRLFLEHSPHALRIPLAEQSADAGRREDALLSNPEVGYQTEEAGGVRDEFLTVSQELPMTGRRGLASRSASAAAEAAGLAATSELLAAVSEVRMSFYDVLYRESVSARLRQGQERVVRIVKILEQREREGEGSGYDLLRAQQELSGIELDVMAAVAGVAVARTRFGAFFGADGTMETARLVGEVRVSGSHPDPDEAVARALAERSDLRALRATVQVLELDRRAARKRRFPEPTLTAGWKRTGAVGLDDSGFVAGLRVALPVFDRGQVALARAEADRRHSELEVEILERKIRADVQAALVREKAARQAADRYGDGVERRAAELRTIADLAYAEGEAGILELLDAYRTSLAMELRALAVRFNAKRAEIERDRAIGIEVGP